MMTLQRFESFDDMYEYISSHPGHALTEEQWYSWENITSLPVPRLSHYVTFGEYLQQLYADKELVDVQIEVERRLFKAHRVVLACFSKYFSSLLLSNQSNTFPLEIKLLGVTPSAFATFLEFIYTGNLSTDPDDVIDLLIMAEYLDVRALRKRLNLSTGSLSLLDAVRLLVRCKCAGPLYTKAFTLVLREFMSAVLLVDFMDIKVDNFCKLLASDNLMAPREYDVFQVAIRWLVRGGQDRVQYTARVMRLVRFCHMTQSQLFECVEETRMFADYTELRDLVLIANWIISAGLLGRREPFQFPVMKRRAGYAIIPPSSKKPPLAEQQPTKTPLEENEAHRDSQKLQTPMRPSFVSAVSFLRSSKKQPLPEKQPNKMPLEENETLEALRASHKLPTPITSSYGPAVSFGEVNTSMTSSDGPRSECQSFMSPLLLENSVGSGSECRNVVSPVPDTSIGHISGCENAVSPVPESSRPLPENITEIRQLLGSKLIEPQNATRKLPPAARTSPETVKRFSEFKVDIFVVGGFQKQRFEQARSVFKESWVRFCDLPSPRQHHAAVLVARTIYLIGGQDPTGLFPNEPTNTVFAIEIDGKTWVTKPRMGDARMKHCACAVNDDLYVFGGIGKEKSILSTVEQFNTRSNTWTFVAIMTSPRYGACAATLDGKCYVAGGRNSLTGNKANSFLDLFECYDPGTNTWSMKNNIRKPRYYAALVNVCGNLYLCGGLTLQSDHSKPKSLYAIDVYRPISRDWALEADMMTSRHASGVTVAGSRIYIIGGRSEPSGHVLRSVECYDTAQRKWCPKPDDLPYPAKGITCFSALQRL